MKTTLFSSGNCHTEKQSFWKKALRLKHLVCPKYSELGAKDPQVMILFQFYTIPQMNGPEIFHTLYDKQLNAWISHYLVRGAPKPPYSKQC